MEVIHDDLHNRKGRHLPCELHDTALGDANKKGHLLLSKWMSDRSTHTPLNTGVRIGRFSFAVLLPKPFLIHHDIIFPNFCPLRHCGSGPLVPWPYCQSAMPPPIENHEATHTFRLLQKQS